MKIGWLLLPNHLIILSKIRTQNPVYKTQKADAIDTFCCIVIYTDSSRYYFMSINSKILKQKDII